MLLLLSKIYALYDMQDSVSVVTAAHYHLQHELHKP
jgi:hypothetical protein